MSVKKMTFWYGVCHALAMLTATIWAALNMNIMNAGFLFAEPWYIATFIDTYLAFLLVYLWVAYLETTNLARLFWAVLFICLGNIAMGIYIAHRATKLTENATWADFIATKLECRND